MSVDTFSDQDQNENMTSLDAKIEKAWQSYAPLGSAEYQELNSMRANTKKVDVYRHGSKSHSLTIIGNVNIDPDTGELISGHDHRPEAQSMKDIEREFDSYLKATDPEGRILIYEGNPRSAASRDEAISLATESGLLQWLGKQNNVEAEPGEPSDLDIAATLEQQGISRLDLAAHYCVRSISGTIKRNGIDALPGQFHYEAVALGLPGFHGWSEAEKQAMSSAEAASTLHYVKAKVEKELLPTINGLLPSS